MRHTRSMQNVNELLSLSKKNLRKHSWNLVVFHAEIAWNLLCRKLMNFLHSTSKEHGDLSYLCSPACRIIFFMIVSVPSTEHGDFTFHQSVKPTMANLSLLPTLSIRNYAKQSTGFNVGNSISRLQNSNFNIMFTYETQEVKEKDSAFYDGLKIM